MPAWAKCGATVAEKKAFCQGCGGPMTPQARTPTQPAQPNLGATVIVPPSEWPSMSPGATRPAQPTPPPKPSPAATAPQMPPAAQTPRPTTPTPAPAPTQATNQRGLVYVLVGAVVLLLIIIALVLLR